MCIGTPGPSQWERRKAQATLKSRLRSHFFLHFPKRDAIACGFMNSHSPTHAVNRQLIDHAIKCEGFKWGFQSFWLVDCMCRRSRITSLVPQRHLGASAGDPIHLGLRPCIIAKNGPLPEALSPQKWSWLCQVHLWSEHLTAIGRAAILWFRQ